jgi:hypothetical protein
VISAAIGFFTSTGVLDEVDAVFTAKESVCLFHFLIVFHVDQDAVRATLSVSGQPQARASETPERANLLAILLEMTRLDLLGGSGVVGLQQLKKWLQR